MRRRTGLPPSPARPRLHVRGLGVEGWEATGEGPDRPPVLLLHGFTGSSSAWGDDLLVGLSAGRPVLAVDLPGHGRSPMLSSSPSGAGVENVLDALVEVLDTHGIARAEWVGYSMGGRVALAAAATRGERVRRLVLESASPGLETENERADRRASDETLARRIEDRGIEWFVDHWMSLPLFETQRRLPESLVRRARDERLARSPAGLASSLRSIGTGAQPSFWPHLPGTTAPTLLITGRADRKYEGLAVRMGKLLPDSRHRSVEGVGHAVYLEAPDRWLAAVDGFLGGPEPPSARKRGRAG